MRHVQGNGVLEEVKIGFDVIDGKKVTACSSMAALLNPTIAINFRAMHTPKLVAGKTHSCPRRPPSGMI